MSHLETASLAEEGQGSPLRQAVQRLERRLESGRTWGRDVDAGLDELAELVYAHWPASPLHRADFACRFAAVVFAWTERASEPHRSLRVLGDVAVSRIDEGLRGAADLPADFADDLLRVWRAAPLELHDILSRVLASRTSPAVLAQLEETLARDVMRQLGGDAGGLIRAVTSRTVTPPGWGRNQAILLARIRSRTGDLEGALRVLDRESTTDPRILEAAAETLLEHGRVDDAVERLKRALVVTTEPERVRETLFEIALRRNDLLGAIEQIRVLLEERSDLSYWYVLVDFLAGSDPNAVRKLRDQLQERSPSLYVEILMAEGDRKAVAIASGGKTFPYELLWRMGDFLAPTDPAAAAQVYERAFLLHGAVAQSRSQCSDLATRVTAVLPFFTDYGRPTLLRRTAREILARQKNNVPLRRELERVFGVTF